MADGKKKKKKSGQSVLSPQWLQLDVELGAEFRRCILYIC